MSTKFTCKIYVDKKECSDLTLKISVGKKEWFYLISVNEKELSYLTLKAELRSWMMPADYDQHQAEAQHLIHEADRLAFSPVIWQRQQNKEKTSPQAKRHKLSLLSTSLTIFTSLSIFSSLAIFISLTISTSLTIFTSLVISLPWLFSLYWLFSLLRLFSLL